MLFSPVPPAPLLLALLTALWLGAPAAAAQGNSAAPMTVRELGGGARLVLLPTAEIDRAELVFALDRGWLCGSGADGLALCALAPCTPDLDPESFSRAAAERGVPFHLGVEADHLAIAAAGDGSALVWLAGELLRWLETAPYRSDATVERQPWSGIDELRAALPALVASPADPWAWPRPFGRVPRAELERVHRAHLSSRGLVIGLRGAFEAEPTVEALREPLERLAARSTQPAPAPLPWQVETRGGVWIFDQPQADRAQVLLLWPGPSERDPEEAALNLWRYAVAGPGLDRLATSLSGRTLLERGSAARAPRAQFLELGLDVPVRNAAQAAEGLLARVADAHGDGAPSEDELDFFRGQARQMLGLIARLPDAGLDLAVRNLAMGLPADHFPRRLAALASVDTRAAASAAKRWMDPAKALLVIAGPAERIAAQLAEHPSLGARGPHRWLGRGAGTEAGAALAERLLKAVGGQEPWAALSHAAVVAKTTIAVGDREVQAHSETLRDFVRFGLAVSAGEGPAASVTVLVGHPLAGDAVAWRRSANSLSDLPREATLRILAAERRALPRVLSRLARGQLSAEVEAGGRLRLLDGEGEVFQLALDDAGLPLSARWTDGELDVEASFEDWQRAGELWYPRLQHTVGSDRRTLEISAFQTDPPLQGNEFQRPQ